VGQGHRIRNGVTTAPLDVEFGIHPPCWVRVACRWRDSRRRQALVGRRGARV